MSLIDVELSDFDGSSYWDLAQEHNTSVAKIRMWEAALMGKNYKPGKWDFVDWAKTDQQLSEEMGVTPESVQKYRRERCSEKKAKKDANVGLRLPSLIKHTLEFQMEMLAKRGVPLKGINDFIRVILLNHLKEFPLTSEKDIKPLKEHIRMKQTWNLVSNTRETLKELLVEKQSKED